jgi:hypothetical protein
VARDRIAHQAPVVREHVGVTLAELVQELRRTLDVREQESDGAGWQVLHIDMMTPLLQLDSWEPNWYSTALRRLPYPFETKGRIE